MTRTIASMCAVLLLVVAGCGGDSATANRYVGQVNDAQAKLTQRFTAIAGRVANAGDAPANGRVLEEYEAAVADAVANLRAITAPGDVSALHRRLIGQTQSLGAAVAQARAVFERQNARKIIKAQTDLNSAVAATLSNVNELTTQINEELRK